MAPAGGLLVEGIRSHHMVPAAVRPVLEQLLEHVQLGEVVARALMVLEADGDHVLLQLLLALLTQRLEPPRVQP